MATPSRSPKKPEPTALTYASSGIDLDRYDRFIGQLPSLMRRTHGPRVIANPGGFAGMFRLDFDQKLFARNYREPVLCACADGVGTKIRIAQEMQVYDTIGIDLVGMNVNDLIVEGAEPLFFLDILSVPQVEAGVMAALLAGVAKGCELAGCALLGGETAEMGDLYADGDFDLNGFAVGVVELKRAMQSRHPSPGDVVLGLASSGPHSNGYTLIRAIVKKARLKLDRAYPELEAEDGSRPTLGEALLEPTRLYADSITRLGRAYRVKKVVTAMAHITGGGLAENLARSLGPDVDAKIDLSSWSVPPVLEFLAAKGRIEPDEMRRVFNMGIGYVVVVRPTFAQAVAQRLRKRGETVYPIGRIVRGKGRVR